MIKTVAILFLAASLIFGVLTLKDAYYAYAELHNQDKSRAGYIVTEQGSSEYVFRVDNELVARLEKDAWIKGSFFLRLLAVGAIVWGLAEISDKLRGLRPGGFLEGDAATPKQRT
jgi:hypothetical protein